jgi:hypothetical protein
MPQISDLNDCDGFMFIPGEEENTQEYRFITLTEDFGELEGNNMYHVVYFKQDEEGKFLFDGTVDAVFGDPILYAKNLCGTNVAATFVKKRKYSGKWVESYLKEVRSNVTIA